MKVSQHGLGHLLNPLDPDDPSRDWIEDAWRLLLRRAHGLDAEEPHWLDRPALTPVTASGPTVLRWFEGSNEGKPYAERITPANFLLLAHPDPFDPSEALPIAPYEPDTSRWDEITWIDRRTGKPVGITTTPADGVMRPGVVRVRTYRDVLNGYVSHPEAKSLGRDAKPVTGRTVGLLRRRPVEGVLPLVMIGKEGNKLEDRLSGLVTEAPEYRSEFVDPDHTFWTDLVVPVLRKIDRTTLAEKSALSRRTIERQLSGAVRPRETHEQLLAGLAVEYARSELAKRVQTIPRDPMGVLQCFLSEAAEDAARCGQCGKLLTGSQRSWSSDRCRKRHERVKNSATMCL